MVTKQHESGQISVTLIKYSISEHDDKVASFELEYPRFIHSELMTHRVFSRNAMSSRAVPIGKMIEQVRDNPAMPIHWGANQAGMQATHEIPNYKDFGQGEYQWIGSAVDASKRALEMHNQGYHKQVVNRILEPYQRMKTVVTATEWDNFFYLRCHKDAQPEIKVLAELMRDCMEESEPQLLKAGEWHIPYVSIWRDDSGSVMYGVNVDKGGEGYPIRWLSLEDALKVSASCCAQVSYRLLDNSLDKAIMIYDKLIESKPEHSSPFEHQAKVMDSNSYQGVSFWDKGITHIDGDDMFWSANFKGWTQYRQLL